MALVTTAGIFPEGGSYGPSKRADADPSATSVASIGTLAIDAVLVLSETTFANPFKVVKPRFIFSPT